MTFNELFKDLPQELRDRFATDNIINHMAHFALHKNWNERQFLIGLIAAYAACHDELKEHYQKYIRNNRQTTFVITKDGSFPIE